MTNTRNIFFHTLLLMIFILPGTNGENVLSQDEEQGFVIDSDVTFEEAVAGISIPQSILENLRLVDVYYYGFDEKIHKGQLVVHKDVVLDVIEIFELIRESRFPIGKVVPISKYGWSDEKSMQDNNTSAFNYRFISGSRVISNHAAGLAIDINPALNPYIKNGHSLPENCVYDTTKVGTISASSELVKEFKQRGWEWGGDWKSLKDYQHFEKKLK
ncbi:MAG TPA: M15 family metallopeptidase [Ignavibacteriaceae bacterium]|nr:M15 family metallopeptidase [Ignavibacteriaceae bacterium]